MLVEQSLAAIAVPREDMPPSFDFGAFLVQLEKEGPRQGFDALELAHELYPSRMDAFQRKFLITMLGTMVYVMQTDDARSEGREHPPMPNELADVAVEFASDYGPLAAAREGDREARSVMMGRLVGLLKKYDLRVVNA